MNWLQWRNNSISKIFRHHFLWFLLRIILMDIIINDNIYQEIAKNHSQINRICKIKEWEYWCLFNWPIGTLYMTAEAIFPTLYKTMLEWMIYTHAMLYFR